MDLVAEIAAMAPGGETRAPIDGTSQSGLVHERYLFLLGSADRTALFTRAAAGLVARLLTIKTDMAGFMWLGVTDTGRDVLFGKQTLPRITEGSNPALFDSWSRAFDAGCEYFRNRQPARPNEITARPSCCRWWTPKPAMSLAELSDKIEAICKGGAA
jgi:hypothetical protein